jgi:hypothetical protein
MSRGVLPTRPFKSLFERQGHQEGVLSILTVNNIIYNSTPSSILCIYN